METTKRFITCGIGGALCLAVAWFVQPAWCWLWLIAGFAGGYLAYEFKAIVKIVWSVMSERGKEARILLNSFGPILGVSLLVTTPFTIGITAFCGYQEFLIFDTAMDQDFEQIRVAGFILIGLGGGVLTISNIVCMIVVGISLEISGRYRKQFFAELGKDGWDLPRKSNETLTANGYLQLPMTYHNTLKRLVDGAIILPAYFFGCRL